MLPKEKRLNLKVDFKRVAAGKKTETKFLKIFILKNQEQTKLGIAVPSKVYKKANARNRVRRIISTAFQQILPTLPEGLHILVLPKEGLLEVKSQELEQDIKNFL